jgi:thiol-disulfide isomerase/thioredoxin
MASRLEPTTRIPSLDGATGWLNSPPLTPVDLRGKVVLVDFWTYTCINWLRTLPYIRAWSEKYEDQGLVVIGAHTPEFPFEHDRENVERMVGQLGVNYPVAIDSDYGVWHAFANRYWPAVYLADADGVLRYQHFGEGRYPETEGAIQELLGSDDELVSVEGPGLEAPADWDELGSPETYLGYGRGERFASPGGEVANEPSTYDLPEKMRVNHWALGGEWTVRRDAVVSHEPGGRLAFRFHARDLHLVLAPTGSTAPVRFSVRIDGKAPGASHGDDIDERGNGVLAEPRLYQLIRQPGPIEERIFEIAFHEPGAQAYAFTFG